MAGKKLGDAEHRRLAAIVDRTASDHDGEALTALRMAHRLAAAVGLTLTEALRAGASAEIDLTRIMQLEADAFERGREKGLEEGRKAAGARGGVGFGPSGGEVGVGVGVRTMGTLERDDWMAMRNAILGARSGLLNEREFEFVVSLDRWGGRLTDRQEGWLKAIWTKVHGAFVPPGPVPPMPSAGASGGGGFTP